MPGLPKVCEVCGLQRSRPSAAAPPPAVPDLPLSPHYAHGFTPGNAPERRLWRTADMQAAIAASQNPANCTAATYMRLMPVSSGVGSTLHGIQGGGETPTSYGTTAPIPMPQHSGYGNFSSEYFSTEVEEGIGRAQDVLRARWPALRACEATPADAARPATDAARRATDAAAAYWIVT